MNHEAEDILAIASGWKAAGEQVALATVTETWGSSPRPAGSQLAVFSPPGSVRPIQMSSDPSGFFLRPGVRSPMEKRFRRLEVRNSCPSGVGSYMVIDQKLSTGGSFPAAKLRR